jgi:hypothetical protein
MQSEGPAKHVPACIDKGAPLMGPALPRILALIRAERMRMALLLVQVPGFGVEVEP